MFSSRDNLLFSGDTYFVNLFMLCGFGEQAAAATEAVCGLFFFCCCTEICVFCWYFFIAKSGTGDDVRYAAETGSGNLRYDH